jgi:hypothetical protein
MLSSKGQGLSMNTIIIGALVLIVLIILVGITTGYLGNWRDKFASATATTCEEAGGQVFDSDTCSGGKKKASGFYENVKSGQVCCLSASCNDLRDANCKSECGLGETPNAATCSGNRVCCIAPAIGEQ